MARDGDFRSHATCIGIVFPTGFFQQGVAPMKIIIRGGSKLKARAVACLALGLVIAGCASNSRPVVVGQPMVVPTLNDYCAIAQKEIASSRVPARNVLDTDFQAFSRAAPSVKPLETLQYVGYADPQRTKARM